jgi:hypothetical protein
MDSTANYHEESEPETESAIRSLFRLADELSESRREWAKNDFRDRPREEKPASNKRMSAPPEPDPYGSLKLFGVLVAGLAIGGAIGWQAHDTMRPTVVNSRYRPASLTEAHRLLSADFGRFDKPIKRLPATIPPAYEKDTIEKSTFEQKRAPQNLKGDLPPTNRIVDPLPVAMPPTMSGSLPPSDGTAAEIRPNLHALEARVRTAIADAGGHVTRTHESDTSLTLTVSISPNGGPALRSAVRQAGNGQASVSEFSSDESDSETDPVQGAELKAAQDSVISLKAQLAKDEVSFLPEAPALKSIKAQYVEALKELSKLQRANRKSATYQVVISAN